MKKETSKKPNKLVKTPDAAPAAPKPLVLRVRNAPKYTISELSGIPLAEIDDGVISDLQTILDIIANPARVKLRGTPKSIEEISVFEYAALLAKYKKFFDGIRILFAALHNTKFDAVSEKYLDALFASDESEVRPKDMSTIIYNITKSQEMLNPSMEYSLEVGLDSKDGIERKRTEVLKLITSNPSLQRQAIEKFKKDSDPDGKQEQS